MKPLIFFISLIFCLPYGSNCQSALIFTGDTVITAACGGTIEFDSIKIYNVTEHQVVLGWKRIRFDAPNGGSGFLIVDPHQYLLDINQHFVGILPGDSSQVIFAMFPDTLYPGDSMFWQLQLFDAADSAQTNQLVTAIAVCPLSIAVKDIESKTNMQLFPNPFNNSTSLLTDLNIDQARTFDLTGRLIRVYNFDGDQLIMNRDGLKPGMYITALYNENIQVGLVKMLVSD